MAKDHFKPMVPPFAHVKNYDKLHPFPLLRGRIKENRELRQSGTREEVGGGEKEITSY